MEHIGKYIFPDRLRRFARQLVRHHYNAISFVAGFLADELE
jgi:hypothetical protein